MTSSTELFAAPHGLVFVYDPDAVIDVPEDTSEGPILGTETCISIWTVQAMDGKVRLTISDDPSDIRGTKRYSGLLRTQDRCVAINDAEVNEIVRLHVEADEVLVEVYTNDPASPSDVMCLLRQA